MKKITETFDKEVRERAKSLFFEMIKYENIFLVFHLVDFLEPICQLSKVY